MKAIQISRIGGPDVLELVDVPIPKPGPGEVLVQTHAIGVAYPEILVRTGKYPWMPKLPFIPGNEMSGRVVDANGSTRVKNGQPVFMASWDIDFKGGLYAEYVAVPERSPWLLPEHVDLDEAGAVFNYIVGLCLLRYGARGAEKRTVVVRGAAGGLGTALIDLCRAEGADVIGLVGSAEKAAYIHKRGATHAVDYSAVPIVETVKRLTKDRGADIIFNPVAGDSFQQDLQMLAPLGLIVSYAVIGGMPSRDLFIDMRKNVNSSPAIRSLTTHTFDTMPEPRNRAVEEAIALLATKKIAPAIEVRLPLAEAARAHALLESRTTMGKILLKP